MKSPEEIKNGIMEAFEEVCRAVDRGDAQGVLDAANQASESLFEALDCIRHFDARVPRWISVEERMPEPFENVLVFTDEKELLICHLDRWWWVANFDGESVGDDYTITHWMPLPEAPEEDAK